MSAGGGRGGSAVPDEEWERFLRDSVAGTADAPREPSAQERGRTAESPGRSAGAPPVWRASAPARPRRRGKGWYVAGMVAAVAVLAVSLTPGLLTDWFGAGDIKPLAVESRRPDQAPPPETPERATLAEPFLGSPAARWADGAAGVGMPRPKATGWMNSDQVGRALERTRDFLSWSNLDRQVLEGKRPAKAISLINPHQQDVQAFLGAAFRKPDRESDPVLLFSRFDPATTRLVGETVKARGRLTFEEGPKGSVRVTGDVTYVYPVVRAQAGSEDVVRTIVRREVVVSWDDPAKIVTEPGTFSLVSYKVDMTNGGCGPVTGFLTPDFDRSRSDVERNGSTVDPYDRSTSMDGGTAADGGCGTATRS